VVLLFERKTKTLVAFLATGLILAVISIFTVGLDGTAHWVRLVLYEQTDFVPHSMFNLRALFVRFGSFAGVAATALTLLGFAITLWRGSFAQKASAAVLTGLLLSPHTYNQDASLAALLPFLSPAAAVRYAVLLPWPYFDPLRDQRNVVMVVLSLAFLTAMSIRLLRTGRHGASERTAPW
jgi:hypothetical protein